jgi:hypothetical protein
MSAAENRPHTQLHVGNAYAFQPLAADEDEGAAEAASPNRPRAWWKRPEQRWFRRGIIGLMTLAIIGLVVAVVVISGDGSGGGSGPHPSGGGGGGSCLKRDSEFMFWNGMTDSSTWYDWLDTKAGQSFKTRVPATGKVLNVQADWGSHLSSQAYANPNFMKTFDDKIRKWNPKASTQS